MKTATCPCGQRIIWCVTAYGKRQPIDYEPTPTGNIFLIEREDGTVRAMVVRPAERADMERIAAEKGETLLLYIPHHATCSKVGDFRKKNPKGSATEAGVFGRPPE